MNGRSILLALSGSQQSWFASKVCWSLSKRLSAAVVAQHVVDSHSAWQFLGHDKPGFLPALDYLKAYQLLCASLFSLGEDLAGAYYLEATNSDVSPACVIDEGNPVEQICLRAKAHDLVVIGHKPAILDRQNPRSQFARLSTAEALAHDCPRPLLVVQEPVNSWKNLAIMCSTEHINERFIDACLILSLMLGLNPVLVCLAGGPIVDPVAFLHDLRESNAYLEQIPIALTNHASEEIVNDRLIWSVVLPDDGPDISTNSLVVVPTRELDGRRITVLGGDASVFVRHLNLPAIMLWPEEHLFSFAAPKQDATAALLEV
jgi:nucleotide-binding universal stress UspA family protein